MKNVTMIILRSQGMDRYSLLVKMETKEVSDLFTDVHRLIKKKILTYESKSEITKQVLA